MFRDIFEVLAEVIKKIVTSRIFALAVIFTLMFSVLIGKLFDLQIVMGDYYLDYYIQQKTKKTVTIPSTRGNIYDKNGNVLAYNELAYSVTIQDTGAYPEAAQKNAMLLRLVKILESHSETVQGKFEVALGEDGEFFFTSSSDSAKKRFLRDFYGRKSVDDLDQKGKYPSDVTARELVEQKRKGYKLDEMIDADGNPVVLTDKQLLDMINIRYTMSLTAYQSYKATTVASYVGEETVAAIEEHMAQIQGVSIEDTTIRVYNDSIYFAPIIGYTGKIMEDQLEELRKKNPDYEGTDTVGRIGIESYMEEELQGTKGSKTMFVGNMGQILEVTEQTDPSAGKDVYLTIDRELQIGIYKLLEQHLAGVLVGKIKNKDIEITDKMDTSDLEIPVKDAYYQLINNNVLSLSKMGREDASEIERQIKTTYETSRNRILEQMKNELDSTHPTAMKDLPKDMSAYMSYLYTKFQESGIIMKDKLDINSPSYQAWKTENSSLRELLYAGIAESWIDTTKLDIENKYSNADDIFNILVEHALKSLETDDKFAKKIYRYMVNDEVITGRELCLALFAQGVLPEDPEAMEMLRGNGSNYAYTFIIDKISKLELTPAQLALDPCTAGCVVTDVKTGEVLALVTYPSYDNNRISDITYYSQLQNDLSLPLYNNATQVKKAPGSTFKPITAIAGLEEYAVNLTDKIDCTGEYLEVSPKINCWIYPGHHGPLDIVGGIKNSCNYFFAEVAHRLSIDENGTYSPQRGISAIRTYASMFGLDRTTGIEISEVDPEITTEAPERSAIGQGTHLYSNIQLSRYVAALANRGTVFNLSLLDKLTDSKGNLITDFTPEAVSHIDIAESTWNAVQTGMRQVVSEGSAKRIFADLEVDIAGKTGTAQESKVRANHGVFISYAPYTNPEICITVNIPNGYSSSNAAAVAKSAYRLYYGYTSLEQIMNNKASSASNITIRD